MSDKEALANLGEHPAWKVLEELVKERMEWEFLDMAKLQMSGKHISQEKIEYKRGFFAGMAFLIRTPQLEAAKLREAIEGGTERV